MPFKSEKQRRYMYANEPAIAKKWSKKYGNKIKKFKGGGMDASQDDFGSPSGKSGNKGSDHSHTRFDVGSGYYGEKVTTSGGKGDTKTNRPPIIAKTISCLEITLIAPKDPPSDKDPVSPIKIFAGGALYHKKPKHEPTIEPQKIEASPTFGI